VVVGGGPAGLMAADVCSAAGIEVDVLEQRPSTALKFLMAGRGGLNLSHADAADDPARFASRYSGTSAVDLRDVHLPNFGGRDVTDWAAALGHPTFTGSSRRVFPVEMKASPLLRSWLRRLEARGVKIRTGQRFQGFLSPLEEDSAYSSGVDRVHPFRVRDVKAGNDRVVRDARALVLALGGASWPRLGSDGSWVPGLRQQGVQVEDFQPANAGVVLAGVSPAFLDRHAGSPLKHVSLEIVRPERSGGGDGDAANVPWRVRAGELLVTAYGLQGGAVYEVLPHIRHLLAEGCGEVLLELDLKPQVPEVDLAFRLGKGGGRKGPARRLRERAGLQHAAVDLAREVAGGALPLDPAALAAAVKRCRVRVSGISGLNRAISSAGGVVLPSGDGRLDLSPALPGVYVAGEMLDWEAPTGGYLLTASLSLGHAAGLQVLKRLGCSSDLQV